MRANEKSSLEGLIYGIAAYTWWGFAAIYFKLLSSVSPLEILAHRIVWAFVILVALVTIRRLWPAMRAIVDNPRTLLLLSFSTVLIAVNWYVYIWAVTNSRMVEAGLGYFMNPLVSVLLGALFLKERLRAPEWISVGLAGGAVLWLTLSAGVFPWISLVLAFSFALYGLLRKLAAPGAVEGLTIETALLLPIALGYLLLEWRRGLLHFGNDTLALDLLLMAGGAVTAIPLLWFAAAVKRLRLVTIGLLQYIAPTIQVILAVLVYGEPFAFERKVAFTLIWVAILLYSGDNLRRQSARSSQAA